MESEVKILITKAKDADTSNEAMQFSQAAVNAAKAMRELRDIKILSK